VSGTHVVARPQRVAVVGVSGAGKSTLAAQVAAHIGAQHTELDALYWQRGWQPVAPEVFRARVDAVTSKPSWIVCGNYGAVRELIWSRADTLIWLDYSLPQIFARLIPRTLSRTRHGTELWNGNRERLSDQLLSRESIFLWAIQSHPKQRRSYPKLLAELALHHFKRPQHTERWLQSLLSAT
jgi:adenylate kinase family enzyme